MDMIKYNFGFGTIKREYDRSIILAIQPYMLDALERYVQNGCPVCSFLSAVLDGDLFEAVARADESSLRSLKAFVMLIYNYFPASSWGSKKHREKWIADGGIKGLIGEHGSMSSGEDEEE